MIGDPCHPNLSSNVSPTFVSPAGQLGPSATANPVTMETLMATIHQQIMN